MKADVERFSENSHGKVFNHTKKEWNSEMHPFLKAKFLLLLLSVLVLLHELIHNFFTNSLIHADVQCHYKTLHLGISLLIMYLTRHRRSQAMFH